MLEAFAGALSRRKSDAAAALFAEGGFWRDMVAFTWDIRTLDFDADTLTVNGKTYSLKPLGEVRPVIDAGGLFNYARQSGMIAAK